MKLLALETSTTACSIALMIDDVIYQDHQVAPRQHANIILSQVKALLEKANLSLSNLDAIAFGRGPGSFTGIRLASSVAQGLAFGGALTVIPISSLAAIAQTAYTQFGWDNCLVIQDARVEQFYWASYIIKDGYAELQSTESVSKSADIYCPEINQWYGLGDAWATHSTELAHLLINAQEINATILPTASAIAKLAQSEFKKKGGLKPTEALPLYLR